GILRRQTNKDNETDVDQNIAVEIPGRYADHRREDAHWNDENDRKRKQPAFVLCGQKQEYEDDSQTEYDNRGVTDKLFLQCNLGPLEAETLRQLFLGDRLDRRNGLSGREPARKADL